MRSGPTRVITDEATRSTPSLKTARLLGTIATGPVPSSFAHFLNLTCPTVVTPSRHCVTPVAKRRQFWSRRGE